MLPLDFLREPLWQSLTWTLLHFVWQGLAVAAVATMLLCVWPLRRADHRYLVYLSALVAMAACPLVTLTAVGVPESAAVANYDVEVETFLAPAKRPDVELVVTETQIGATVPTALESHLPPEHSAAASERSTSAAVPVPVTWKARLPQTIDAIQPYALVAWIAGVMLLGMRLSLSWLQVRWLAWGRRVIPADLATKAAKLSERLSLRRPPRICTSEKVREAIVVGLWRPLVLLPTSWLMAMTPEVLEAVIAHELAHVRRLDLWVNLLQRLLETLLFYHPAVWWISRRVSLEREMCADELAVAATKERLAYATALEQLGRMRLGQTVPQFGAGMGSSKMVLLKRVGNILGASPSTTRGRWWPVGLLALAIPLAIWLASTSIVASTENETRAEEVADDAGDEPTLDSQASLSIIDTEGKPVVGARVQFAQYVNVESNGRRKGEYVVVAHQESNTEGYVEIPPEALLAQGTSSLVVRVDAEGYVSRHGPHEAALTRDPGGKWFVGVTNGVFSRSIVLLTAGSISGRVLGPDGKPLAGVPMSMTTDCDYEDYWQGGAHPPNRAGYLVANHLRAISGENGEFRFEGVPPGEVFLYYPWDGPTNAEVADGRWNSWIKPGESSPSTPTKGLTWGKPLHMEEGQQVNEVLVDLSKSTCVVKGRVGDAEGRPVVGALVDVAWQNGHTVPSNERPVRTDGDGKYRITGLPPSEVTVFATIRLTDEDAPRGERQYRADAAARLSMGEIVKADLRFDAKIDLPVMDEPVANQPDEPAAQPKLPQPYIAGRVTDATGEPLAGALIEWGYYRNPSAKWQRTTTDAEGQYRLELKDIGVGFRLGVSAPGVAPTWQVPYKDWIHPEEPWRDEDAVPPKRMDFQLEPMHWIAGTVVDQDGKPIAGVGVNARTFAGIVRSSFFSPTPSMPIPGDGDYEIDTDGAGRFRLAGLPAKHVQLHFDAAHRHVNDQNYVVDHEHRVVMSGSGRPGILRARVVDALTGKPVEQFNVACRYDPQQRQVISPDGRFLWREVRDEVLTEGGRYLFYVYSRDYAPAEVRIPAVSPDSQLETTVELSPGSPLVATLVDGPSGKPLAGVPVLYAVVEEDDRYFEWPDYDSYIDGYHSLSLVQRAVTDDDGGFWFGEADGEPQGTLFVVTPGYERVIFRPEDRPASTDSKPVQIGLHPEASISGVLLAEGQPERNVHISLWKSEPRGQLDETIERAVTDSRGYYRFGSLGPGTYKLSRGLQVSRSVTTFEPIAETTVVRGEQKVVE